MLRIINQPVRVVLIADHTRPHGTQPYCIDWAGKRYKVTKFAMYHPYRRGTRKIHVFHVSTESLDMRVEMDSETLECFLTEISDGLAD